MKINELSEEQKKVLHEILALSKGTLCCYVEDATGGNLVFFHLNKMNEQPIPGRENETWTVTPRTFFRPKASDQIKIEKIIRGELIKEEIAGAYIES